MQDAISIFMGQRAAATIGELGWCAAPFTTLIGASGGPKWLILSELDQVLSNELLSNVIEPVTLLGSSIGTWRHACLSQPNPAAAIKRLQRAYLYQEYSSTRPTPQEVSQVAELMLREALGDGGVQALIHQRRFQNAIVTARAKGVARGTAGLPLIAGMTTAMTLNAIARRALGLMFERVTFCQQGLTEVPFTEGFNTQLVTLNEHNLIPALKASGAIPLLMRSEASISGAPKGPYWDGGIIDYHFTLSPDPRSGLVLYPHFRSRLTPGWFDKTLRWRTRHVPALDNLVLICPSDAFLANLPFGKIPDRGDFRALPPAKRVAYWETCVRESGRLAEAFHNLIHGDDPLRGVTVI